jgi:hypothetical protein
MKGHGSFACYAPWESDMVERLKRIEAAAKALLADVRHRYNMLPQAISIAMRALDEAIQS